MNIQVTELCNVDFIFDSKRTEEVTGLTAKRVVIYNSPKDNLIEAIQDYHDNFDSDNIIETHDAFDGACEGTVKYLSFEEYEVENKERCDA